MRAEIEMSEAERVYLENAKDTYGFVIQRGHEHTRTVGTCMCVCMCVCVFVSM